ncbi:MAG: hypothetical protein AB1627_09415 [Chloroflexota bacterium]
MPAALGSAALFGQIAKRDPVGFVSLAGPPIALGLVGLLVGPDERRVLTLVAGIWIIAFVIGGKRMWAWWSVNGLRRTLPSRQRTFEQALSVPVRSFLRALDLLPGGGGANGRSTVIAARGHLAELSAPDPDWQALQVDWLALMDEVAADGDGHPAAVERAVADHARALGARQQTLRGRQPEWRGLYPVFAAGDAPQPVE